MLTTTEMNKVQALLIKADFNDLRVIAKMFNTVQNSKASAATRGFDIGEEVQWTGRNGKQRGTILKVNRKNVKVRVGLQTWNVTATLLERV